MSALVLTDPKRMGGVIAQDGFDYQVWNALIRLPGWLLNPAFDGFILEGFEDFEARFFIAAAPYGHDHVVDRYQAKSASLQPAEIQKIVAQFAEFEAAHPHVARSQVLITPALPASRAWMGRDTNRVKKARPFYAPFPRILEATDRELLKNFTDELGDDLGKFCAGSVDFEQSVVPDRRQAETQFIEALDRAFPGLNLPMARAREAFAALSELVTAKRGSLISRQDAMAALAANDVPAPTELAVRIRSAAAADDAAVLDIDGTQFAGGDAGYPSSSVWSADLVAPLSRAADWARSAGCSRVSVRGQFRLSTGWAFGWAFRSAIGFDLEIPVRGSDPWRTDDHPQGQSQLSLRHEGPPELDGDRLAVAIGVLRDPMPAILKTQPHANILHARLDQAIETSQQAQGCVRAIKALVDDAVATHRPAAIDLYFVGPGALAVAIGHRWNGLPKTQFHEYVSATGTYVPTVQLP